MATEIASLAPASMAQTEHLRPQLFVTRQNGAMVPLIAADELPATVNIRGVSRTLSPHDITGMTGVGTFNSRHRQYVVDVPSRGFHSEYDIGARSLLRSAFAPITQISPVTPRNPQAHGDTALPTQIRASANQEQDFSAPTGEHTDSQENNSASANPASAVPVPSIHTLGKAPGVKEYCSYWIRHGECDYTQQGCLYRHEMPLDPETLKRLELRDIPRWYREKHGILSLLAAPPSTTSPTPGTPSKAGVLQRDWRTPTAEILRPVGDIKYTTKTSDTHRSSDGSPRGRRGGTRKAEKALDGSGAADTAPASGRGAGFKPRRDFYQFANTARYTSQSPIVDPIISRHAPFFASHTKADESYLETVKERQERETIEALEDHIDQERKMRQQLSSFTALVPLRRGFGAPMAKSDTPVAKPETTRTPTSSSGSAPSETSSQEAVAKTSGVEVEVRSTSSSGSGGSDTVVGKRKGGRPRRRGRGKCNVTRHNGDRDVKEEKLLPDHE